MYAFKKTLAVLLALVLCVGILAIPAYAAETSQDGLEVTLTTDKDVYEQGETIVATLKVKNTNDAAVVNVSLENLIPEGYVLEEGSKSTMQAETLAAGETVTLTVSFVSEQTEVPKEPTTGTEPEKPTTGNSEPPETDSPATGDTFAVGVWMLLLLLAIVGLVVVAVKYKLWKQTLSVVLCVAMLVSVFSGIPFSVNAAEADIKTIAIGTTVAVADTQVELKAMVTYQLEVNDTADPEVTTYTVTFESNGGSAVEKQPVNEGETVSVPATPIKEGYLFAGWFESNHVDDWTACFSFDTPILEDLTLYALWVDVTTDTDGDGLADDIEAYIGSVSDTDDTDGDGLTDYEETVLFAYDPTNEDSDADNVKDGDEDHDGDGLTNAWELDYGTDPILRDSDTDGLNDNEEVHVYSTDPVEEDTDNDGAEDGDEIRLGTDPLFAESMFVETAGYGELTENLQVTVNVEAVVEGEQVGTVEIVPVTYGTNPMISPTIPGYLDVAYNITVDGQPKEAVLTFCYDTVLGTIGEEFQPRVYYYNETEKTFEELPDQEVTAGQVRVTVTHFSTYILLNKVEFDKVWDGEIKPPDLDVDTEDAVLDIAFVVDYSHSMEWNDPNQLYKQLSKQFIAKLRDGLDRAAVIKFIRTATLLSPLTSDKDALNAAINGITYDDGYGSNSGTDGSAGIHLALNQLVPSDSKYKYIVFITDGEDNGYSHSYDDLVATAVGANVNIYTVGMGSASESVLKKVAQQTGGKYYHATTSADADDVLNLNEVFEEIENEIIDYTTDSNNDGISDYYTELIKTGKLPLSNGSKEFMGIDFNYDEHGELSDDYDGDGVINGDELLVRESGNKVCVYMVSDPMMEYSDADEYSDYREHRNGTDPMVYTYTHEAVDYPWNDSNFTYVSVFKGEDKWWNEGARQIWSSVTFNWSHQDEAKAVLTKFFSQYSDLEEIEAVSNKIEVEVADVLGNDLLSKAVDLVEDGVMVAEDYKDIAENVKRWINAGHSAKNLSSNHFTQLKAQVGLFEYRYSIKIISAADKFIMGAHFIWDEGTDIYDWIQAYSAMTATQVAFQDCQDVLERIKDNGDAKEKYVTRAAEDILLIVNEEYGRFKTEHVKDLATATTENIGSLALDILSAMNPYVLAINLAIDIMDLTKATEISEATYCLYVIDELVNANKSLFKHSGMTDSYYDIMDSDTRYMVLLICARIWGGEFAKEVTGNQQFIGFFNDDRIRQEYADAIDSENDSLEVMLNCFR